MVQRTLRLSVFLAVSVLSPLAAQERMTPLGPETIITEYAPTDWVVKSLCLPRVSPDPLRRHHGLLESNGIQVIRGTLEEASRDRCSPRERSVDLWLEIGRFDREDAEALLYRRAESAVPSPYRNLPPLPGFADGELQGLPPVWVVGPAARARTCAPHGERTSPRPVLPGVDVRAQFCEVRWICEDGRGPEPIARSWLRIPPSQALQASDAGYAPSPDFQAPGSRNPSK